MSAVLLPGGAGCQVWGSLLCHFPRHCSRYRQFPQAAFSQQNES